MTADADPLDALVEAVADGRPVDWERAEAALTTPEARREAQCLRLLAQMQRLGATPEDSVAAAPPVAAAQPREADAPAAPAAAPVATWGRWQLRECVGEGGFGQVYRAWDPELERDVALKILHPRPGDADLRDRVRHEGRALARINHEHVVTVHGVETHGEDVALCMEFVQGQTLEDLLHQQGAFSAEEATLVGEAVCRALAAVHRAGVVHRDVKARNVMRGHAGRIVLMDFGAGRDLRREAKAGHRDSTGTPLYMAPELFGGAPATPCSDVYSVGVLLYHLVTGGYPIEADTIAALREAHRQGRRRFLRELRPDVPASFARVVERALSPDVEERYPTAAALLEGLSAARAVPTPNRLLALAARAGIGLAGGLVLLTALGWLSTTTYRRTLGLDDGPGPGPGEWLYWGWKSAIAPLFMLTVLWIGAMGLRVLRQLALSVMPFTRRWDLGIRFWADRLAARLSMNDASVLASWLLMLSAAALAIAWWHYAPLLHAFQAPVSTWPPEVLARMSPAFAADHDRYRMSFSALVIVITAASLGLHRWSLRQRRPVPRGVLVASWLVALLALFSLDLPYRLFMHNKVEAATWQGHQCHIIEERAASFLITCATLPPPRNRIVPRAAPGFERLERRESVYTPYSPR